MARILVVDDERVLTWAVRYSLSDEGHEVFIAHDGVEALKTAQLRRPDLVILDIVMPRLDGLEVCRALRRDPVLATVPILFLTARTAIKDRVSGLDEGGDDYLTKPFDTQELKARIRALLRRSASSERQVANRQDSVLVMGDLALEMRSGRVHIGEKAVQLTPIECELLHYFMVHPGETFSAQHLLQQVWGYPEKAVDASVVRWHIKNLRAKIEPDPGRPSHIRTIPHHGYILEEPPPALSEPPPSTEPSHLVR